MSDVFSEKRGTVGLTKLVVDSFAKLWRDALRTSKGSSVLGRQAELAVRDADSSFLLIKLRLFGQWMLAPADSGAHLILDEVSTIDSADFFESCKQHCNTLQIGLPTAKEWFKSLTEAIENRAVLRWQKAALNAPSLLLYRRFRRNISTPVPFSHHRWLRGREVLINTRIDALALGRWFTYLSNPSRALCTRCSLPVEELVSLPFDASLAPRSTDPALLFHAFLVCEKSAPSRVAFFASLPASLPQWWRNAVPLDQLAVLLYLHPTLTFGSDSVSSVGAFLAAAWSEFSESRH